MLLITTYLWCGEGWSARNYGIMQQITALVSTYSLPYIIVGDFNMTPSVFAASGWCDFMDAEILACGENTCTIGAGAQLDFAIISRCLVPLMHISSIPVPWKPHHIGLVLGIKAQPRQVMISKLQVPAELPIAEFNKVWESYTKELQNVAKINSRIQADAMLQLHAIEHGGPAILGQPDPCLANDPKYAEPKHIEAGEVLASAALYTELLVCNVLGIPPDKFIGRSQYPCVSVVPALPKKKQSDKFSSPAANWWGCLDNMLHTYMFNRSNDFKHHKHIHRIQIHLQTMHTFGKASDSDELDASRDAAKNHVYYESTWKDDNLEYVETYYGRLPFKDVLMHLDRHPDSVIAQIKVVAGTLKDKAIMQRGKSSSASWKKFCTEQLSKGAGKLHSWANRPNSLPSVPLFDKTSQSKTPLAALQDKTDHWAKYWQKPSERNAEQVLSVLREACLQALGPNSPENIWDMSKFTADTLTSSAKAYKRFPKGLITGLLLNLC